MPPRKPPAPILTPHKFYNEGKPIEADRPTSGAGLTYFSVSGALALPTPFSALSLPSPAGTRDGAPATGLQLPLAAPEGSWRPAQGAEETGVGPWSPLPLPRWRSWAPWAPILHLFACRTWGEGGLERWAGHDRPGSAKQASLPPREWVSRAVGSWQAIRRARSMGGSSPTAGEEWREGGARQ